MRTMQSTSLSSALRPLEAWSPSGTKSESTPPLPLEQRSHRAEPDRRAAPGTWPLRVRRGSTTLLRPALVDLGHRIQTHLLRHRPRLPLVADPAADALRGPALRLHPDRKSGQRRTALPSAATA